MDVQVDAGRVVVLQNAAVSSAGLGHITAGAEAFEHVGVVVVLGVRRAGPAPGEHERLRVQDRLREVKGGLAVPLGIDSTCWLSTNAYAARPTANIIVIRTIAMTIALPVSSFSRAPHGQAT